jgi:hypothetical protein
MIQIFTFLAIVGKVTPSLTVSQQLRIFNDSVPFYRSQLWSISEGIRINANSNSSKCRCYLSGDRVLVLVGFLL